MPDINTKIAEFYYSDNLIKTDPNSEIANLTQYTRQLKAIMLMCLFNKATNNKSFAIQKININNKLAFVINENLTNKPANNQDNEFLYLILLPYFTGKMINAQSFDIASSNSSSTMLITTNISV